MCDRCGVPESVAAEDGLPMTRRTPARDWRTKHACPADSISTPSSRWGTSTAPFETDDGEERVHSPETLRQGHSPGATPALPRPPPSGNDAFRRDLAKE